MYEQTTAPQTIGGVLDGGFKLFRASFSKVFWLPAVAGLATAPFNLLPPYFQTHTPTVGVIGLVACGVVVAVLLAVVVYGALIARIDSVARAAPLSVGGALAIGARRLPAMFLTGLLTGLAVFVGLIFLLIPGFIFMIWFVFAPTAVIIERLGPFASLSYSRALVRGHWWRTAGLITVIAIILMIVYGVLLMVVGVLLVTNPSAVATGETPWYVELVLGPLLSVVVAPLSYALMLSIYYDLKTRLEGGDLAARIAATA
jgi:hypothetical protein